jgi:hypothetical protein
MLLGSAGVETSLVGCSSHTKSLSERLSDLCDPPRTRLLDRSLKISQSYFQV